NSSSFDNLILAPGESVIFFEIEQNSTTNEFVSWWGANLPAGLQVRLYNEPGLGSGGDGLQIWDANDNLVDRVEFGAAARGTSFTYNTNNGSFGILTTTGSPGVINAAVNNDLGSPGRTAGPVPLVFLKQPTNLATTAGSSATFTALGQGLPKPHYQWYFN